MKKMRFLLMSAVTCFALFATMSLTSCNKDDVEYSQADEAVLYAGVDGKDASFPCPLCHVDVLPGHYHTHYFADGNCGLNGCTHAGRPHWHILQNHTGDNTGGTWIELTTHFGRTIPAEGDHTGTIIFPHN